MPCDPFLVGVRSFGDGILVSDDPHWYRAYLDLSQTLRRCQDTWPLSAAA